MDTPQTLSMELLTEQGFRYHRLGKAAVFQKWITENFDLRLVKRKDGVLEARIYDFTLHRSSSLERTVKYADELNTVIDLAQRAIMYRMRFQRVA